MIVHMVVFWNLWFFSGTYGSYLLSLTFRLRTFHLGKKYIVTPESLMWQKHSAKGIKDVRFGEHTIY